MSGNLYNVYYYDMHGDETLVRVQSFVAGEDEKDAYLAFKEMCVVAGTWVGTVVLKVEPYVDYEEN